MRVLILIDADNFRNSVLNAAKRRSQFRYVDFYKINNFIMKYLSKNLQYKNCALNHLRTYYYSGEYTDNLIARMEKSLKKEKDRKKYLKNKIEKAKKSKEMQAKFFKMAKNYYFFEVRSKPLQFSPTKVSFFQKGVDVQIAVDLVEFSYKDVFDIIALLSGDIDLLESVKTAKKLGKHVVIFSDESVTSEEMKRDADLFVDIGRLDDRVLDEFTHLVNEHP